MGLSGNNVFEADRAQLMGIAKLESAYLVSFGGVLWIVWPPIIGKLLDMFSTRILAITVVCMSMHVVVMMVCNYVSGFWGQAAVFALFGMNFVSFMTTSVIMARLRIVKTKKSRKTCRGNQ